MIAIEHLRHINAGPAQKARERYWVGSIEPTSGVAPGFTQANMIVLPRDWAFDFLLYAQRNPKACPVLDVSDPGSHATLLAPGADLRTDLPLYRIWRSAVHGAPVHVGTPEAIGIKDLAAPEFGDPVRIEPGEVPVLWTCGVTPQTAVMASRVPFAITHAPGHMFITDIPDSAYHA
ncbi:hypothetical protein IE4872_PD01011 (plasmid) [Rhizobium gallicum]|uniref:DUF1445 domain-containing protein n=1 Tax=Rhizobium gallicum TaxID=56730 RepID=A0A1L5NUI7_9HYPH|nr:DUF1445 domain-containing protein [Rhizobium gallicum]APO71538.1 hypothetical protein IE4872_PD01011 [Rhizobium gallicum]